MFASKFGSSIMATRLPREMAIRRPDATPVVAGRCPSLINKSRGIHPLSVKSKRSSNPDSMLRIGWWQDSSKLRQVEEACRRHGGLSRGGDGGALGVAQVHLKGLAFGTRDFSDLSMAYSNAIKIGHEMVLSSRVGRTRTRWRKMIAIDFAAPQACSAEGVTDEKMSLTYNATAGFSLRQSDNYPGARHGNPLIETATEDARDEGESGSSHGSASHSEIDWYVPRVGDEVLGVIVSVNEYKLGVDIGAEHLGCMLSKDARPLDMFRTGEFFLESLDEDRVSENVDVDTRQVRFVGDGDASHSTSSALVGSVLPLEVSGVTLSGKPLLSVRNYARRMAWHRVRQIREVNEPIRLQCVAWYSEGLIFRIEGLRATLHREQCVNQPKYSNALRTQVGEWKTMLIMTMDEDSGQIVLSERRAWSRIGSLVVGTVERLFPFGVEIAPIGTTLRAMIHVSHISQSPVLDPSSVFAVGEMVKSVIVKPFLAHRIALSTAALESEKGLILHNKAKVFREAEKMAERYRSDLLDDESQDSDHHREFLDPCFANLNWLDDMIGPDRGENRLKESDVLSMSCICNQSEGQIPVARLS